MSEHSWLCSASNPPHLNPLPASGARPDERVQARPGSLRSSREARLSLWQRERIKLRVSTNTAAAAQARSPARRCRVPGEPDDSRTAGQRFSHERATPSAFGREFDPSDSDARHRLIQLRALPPDNRNPVCKRRTDADGEISVPQMASKNTLSIRCLLSQQASAIHEKLFESPKLFLKRWTCIPFTSILSPQTGRGDEVRSSRGSLRSSRFFPSSGSAL